MVAEEIVEEFLETAEDMDTEDIAELLEEAREDHLAERFGASPGSHPSPREMPEEEEVESDEVSDEDENMLDEDRYNSAGEEVRLSLIRVSCRNLS